MSKLPVCELLSVVMAAVLLIADVRHLTMQAPDTPPSANAPISTELRNLLAIQRQAQGNAAATPALKRDDVLKQLNGLSALFSPGAANGAQPHLTAAN